MHMESHTLVQVCMRPCLQIPSLQSVSDCGWHVLFTQLFLMCLLLVNVTSDSDQGNCGLIKSLADRRLALSASVVVAGY